MVNEQPNDQSRRRFLHRGVKGSLYGGAVLLGAGPLLGACSGPSASAPQVVPLFSQSSVIAAGLRQRLPFGLVDDGSVNEDQALRDDQPLVVRVLRDGQEVDSVSVEGRIVTHDHPPGVGDHDHASLLRYYPLRTTLPQPGIYDLEIDILGTTVGLPVQAFDQREVEVLLPGQPFPTLDTPTLQQSADVDPVCTLFEGPCPFHTRTAADVLTAGQPMALLVATPQFCATAYCGPVLNTLIAASSDFPDVVPVHVEPWANPTEGSGLTDPGLRKSPTVVALGLDFEPSLFLVDSNGVLADRIDNVFDTTELSAALAALT